MKDIPIRLNSVFWLSLVILLASCGSASHHFYAGDEGNLLAMKEQGDLKASAGYAPHMNSLPGNNFSGQLGYSPIKHLGLHGSFFRIRNAFEGLEGEKKNVYQYNFNGAIGTYFFKSTNTSEDERNTQQNRGLLVDFYVGYGQGEVDNFFFGKSGKIELDFQKFFAQGGVHLFLDDIEASFALRFTQVEYLKGGRAFGKLTPAELAKKDVIQNNNPFNFLESALKISYGKPQHPLRAFMSITGVYDFGDVFLEIQPSTVQLGVTADIDYYFRGR